LEKPTHRNEDNPKAALRRQHYAGESLRELGVLILVFIPLETILQKPAHSLEVTAVCLLLGFGFVLGGMNLQVEADVEMEENREMENKR
jgi:hypothetical protein